VSIFKDNKGDAVVEATILFPIMIMIFAALVLLAIYLPTRALLQSSSQYAATVISTTISDTWLIFDETAMVYAWETDRNRLPSVYASPLSGISDVASLGEDIVTHMESLGLSSKAGTLTVDCYIINMLVYKEVVVTATREFELPISLAIIRFPDVITITVTSTAVVQNGDEFLRNMELAVDFLEYINKKFNLSDITEVLGDYWSDVSSFFSW